MFLEEHFPSLLNQSFHITSPATNSYNCVAWALEDDSRWWWPAAPAAGYYWPDGAPHRDHIDAFVETFRLFGYEVCEDDAQEEGFEKIAVFGDPQHKASTHVARQLEGGLWTSKLGRLEDITHELEGVAGELYGEVLQFMKRRVSK